MLQRKKQHWLMKSEPTDYSIDDLERDLETPWFGVRNYQARNFMRDSMEIGDRVLFYHSSCPKPGVAGLAEVSSSPYPDATQFDRKSEYYDPKASREKPRWFLVDVGFVKKFPDVVALRDIRRNKKLAGLMILQPGSRLSITPVSKEEYETVLQMD